MARCKSIISAAYINLGQSLDLWAENQEFDNLLQYTAKMFVCVAPDKLALLE